ncbi:MAG: DUF3263 domain-containing protein [Corynebacterium sp.]|nr:DUF3263 domain-containing protein [Corynebacterium sp.]
MLPESDRLLLDFEARAPRSIALKEAAIRAELGLSPVRYFQRLNQIIETKAALAHNPVLVNRLLRRRAERDRARRLE